MHNWVATQCRGKWVCEKEIFFFLLLSLTLSFPYLCFVFLDIPSSLPTSHFFLSLHHVCFPFFLWQTLSLDGSTLPDIPFFLLFLLSFSLKSFSPFPQFNGACRLHHAGTSMAETIASATREAEAGNLNVKPFDTTLWWAPAMDIMEESIHHERHRSTVNWVAMQWSFMSIISESTSFLFFFFPGRSLSQMSETS